jgi:hypothetical protein
MIRKFLAVPRHSVAVHTILAIILMGAATVHAQQTPAQQPADQTQTQQPAGQTQQQPATEQSSSRSNQETEEIPTRQPKPRGYTNWTFNVGGGASLTNGNTMHFVRGGGGIAAAGVARNYSKYFGFRLDFQFDNLPLRTSALQAAQAPGATDHVYSAMLSPIINIPASKNWGGYIIGGPAFLHRSGKLDSSSAIAGSACNTFFQWWGHCFNGNLPINGKFLHSSVNELGEDFGGGITRKIRPNMDIYAEFRYLHGSHAGNSTDLRPITVGIRW